MPEKPLLKPKFFATAGALRKWLERHHAVERDLLVGFYKKDSGQPSMTWPESVDAALCFGWIDGVRRRIDDVSYSIRFTPRKPRSIWSAVNIGRVAELQRAELMAPAGLAAFASREAKRSRVYSFEQERIEFESGQKARFEAEEGAWEFFQTQAPWYRKATTWWVISAKREETRRQRLEKLIQTSREGGRLRQFEWKAQSEE